jgi:hypothetical protein
MLGKKVAVKLVYDDHFSLQTLFYHTKIKFIRFYNNNNASSEYIIKIEI